MKSRSDAPISEAELSAALSQLKGEFTLNQLLSRLGRGRSAALASRLRSRLEADGRFFVDGEGRCRNRADFFTGRTFAVTPDAWEIEQGMLIPGHRFAAFISPEVFLSEITLRYHGVVLPVRELRAPLGQIFHYHHLLGSDGVFDFLAAESLENAWLRRQVRATEPVTLTVFDLSPLPKLEAGDALLATVVDYERGILDIEVESGAGRSARSRKAWIAAFDRALERVCRDFGDYPDLSEQLALGLWYGGDELEEPAASFDEFIIESERIEIRADGDHAVLSIREDDAGIFPDDDHDHDHDHDHEHDHEADGSELLRLSRGETADQAVMLREIGSSLTPVELDSMILDLCHQKVFDFNTFESRAFGRGEPTFADEAQQVVFQNFLEERFEELTENYNAFDDEPKAPLRAAILEMVDDRLELLDFLASRESELPEAAKSVLRRIAETSLRCEALLKMLNDPAFTPDTAELARLSETIGGYGDTMDELTDHLHNILEGVSEDE